MHGRTTAKEREGDDPGSTKDVVAVAALQFRIHAERARGGDTHRRDLGGEMWIGTGMLAHWTG